MATTGSSPHPYDASESRIDKKINMGDCTQLQVVGTGGYKNEKQKKTGNHWAKIYATGCRQNACFEADAKSSARFGALLCDFDKEKNWANCRFKVRQPHLNNVVTLSPHQI